jgi:hypothetical protein
MILSTFLSRTLPETLTGFGELLHEGSNFKLLIVNSCSISGRHLCGQVFTRSYIKQIQKHYTVLIMNKPTIWIHIWNQLKWTVLASYKTNCRNKFGISTNWVELPYVISHNDDRPLISISIKFFITWITIFRSGKSLYLSVRWLNLMWFHMCWTGYGFGNWKKPWTQ